MTCWIKCQSNKFIYFGEWFKFLINENVQKSRRCTHCSCKPLRFCSALCKLSRSFIIFEICILDALFCTCANQHPPIPITTDTIRTRSFIQLCGGPGAKHMRILVRLPMKHYAMMTVCLFCMLTGYLLNIFYTLRESFCCVLKRRAWIFDFTCAYNDTHQSELYLIMTFKKPQLFDQNSLYCGFSQLMIWF